MVRAMGGRPPSLDIEIDWDAFWEGFNKVIPVNKPKRKNDEKPKNDHKQKNDELVAFEWNNELLEVVDAPEREPLQ